MNMKIIDLRPGMEHKDLTVGIVELEEPKIVESKIFVFHPRSKINNFHIHIFFLSIK
jgi:hypothetical protein